MFLHNLLFFQFALSLQFGDTANFLGKQGVADIAVFQSRLVPVVGEVDIPCFTTIYQDNFRPPVFNSRRKADKSCTHKKGANQQQGPYFCLHRFLLCLTFINGFYSCSSTELLRVPIPSRDTSMLSPGMR